MTRTRKDVWNLPRVNGEWPDVLVAYEQAVRLLIEHDPGPDKPREPLGWRFLAAMHGIRAPNGRPDKSNPLWCMCQHGSWYFLPWHRMYLRAFELIVQDALQDDEWSLPYWYSIDPDNPDSLVLPPEFRDQSRGLHVKQRSVGANAGDPLPMFSQSLARSLLEAFAADDFSTDVGQTSFGGGERSEPSFNGLEVGLLEGTPHGGVHGLVGNDYDADFRVLRRGWMGDPYTAAQDPIFWLHHANIDRLWQVWLNLDPAHRNPTDDPAWFQTEFSFPRVGGGEEKWRVGDVLDTESLGYNYESTAPPSAVTPVGPPVEGGPDLGLGEEIVVPERQPPQVIGATQDVPLATSEPVDVLLAEPVDLGLGTEEAAAVAGRILLRIEGLTGTAAAPVYDIYLNVPPGEDPLNHPELGRAPSRPSAWSRRPRRTSCTTDPA